MWYCEARMFFHRGCGWVCVCVPISTPSPPASSMTSRRMGAKAAAATAEPKGAAKKKGAA